MASAEINLRTSKTYNLLIGSIASSENTNTLYFNSAKLQNTFYVQRYSFSFSQRDSHISDVPYFAVDFVATSPGFAGFFSFFGFGGFVMVFRDYFLSPCALLLGIGFPYEL